MPLMGKRLKRKNLSTVTLTGGWPGAKPVRKYKANKKRIILQALREPGTSSRLSPTRRAPNLDWASSLCLYAAFARAHLPPHTIDRCVNTEPAFRHDLEAGRRVCRRRRSAFRTHRQCDRGRFPW